MEKVYYEVNQPGSYGGIRHLIRYSGSSAIAASKTGYNRKMRILYTAQFARDFLGEKRSQKALMMYFKLIWPICRI
jgi:hypothetical protein